MNFTDCFLEENDFRFIGQVRAGEHPWDTLGSIEKIIAGFMEETPDSGEDAVKEFGRIDIIRNADGSREEKSLLITNSVFLAADLCLKRLSIFIGKGTMLEAGAIIKPPCVIGENSEIRQGAYLRGGVIVGDHSVVGHVTEVKNSIFMNHTHAGHFAYVGDSILGNHVNLGAGTKLANLQFRTRAEIEKGAIKEIIIMVRDKKATGAVPKLDVIQTGLSKMGAIIGDFSEIGCNTVTSPATILGAHCWVYPNTSVPKGFYKQKSIIKHGHSDKVEVIPRPVR